MAAIEIMRIATFISLQIDCTKTTKFKHSFAKSSWNISNIEWKRMRL